MSAVDLTPFGYTPTESLIYSVLLRAGPGTGYAVARNAGLARANAYAALEGLVQKGAARVEGQRPRRYRPEAPAALIARITSTHGQELEKLSASLEAAAVPSSSTLVEVETPRAALQLIGHQVARAQKRVELLAPADAYPLLAPQLRRASASGVELELGAVGDASLDFAQVSPVSIPDGAWPATPLIALVDDRGALMASREGPRVTGLWSSSPLHMAAARLAFLHLMGR